MTPAHPSFAQALAAQAQRSPERIALHFEAQQFTYRALLGRALSAARYLERVHALLQGARIAYLGANHVDCISLLAACEQTGAVFCPLNTRLAPTELDAVLADAQPLLVLADAQHLALARSLSAGVRCACEAIDAITALPPPDDWPENSAPAQNRDVLLVYTSGTTGRAKGVIHTVSAMAANLHASIHSQAIGRDDVVLCTLPMFHVGGLCIQLLPALAAGAQAVLQPRFEAGQWLTALGVHAVTLALMVPATMRSVIEHPAWLHTPLDGLRAIAAGSSTIPLALIEAFHLRSVPVMQVYGSTETGPTSTVLDAAHAMAKPGCAGWPAPGVEIRIETPDAQGIGQVMVRGANLMRGYFGAAQSGIDAQGWFATGDLGRLDEAGALWIMGRGKDMLISGGENIYPAELENVLTSLPEVAQCAVIALPDTRWGEVPVACVVRKPQAALTAAAVHAAFEGRLARFKHPKRVVFLEDLPKNAMGKVEKAHLVKIVSALADSSAQG